MTYSREQQINYKNISDKTILTVVVWLEVVYPHGEREKQTFQYECFFAPDVIAPGDEDLLNSPKLPHKTVPLRAPTRTMEPRALVRVMYVQFLDGSVFGEEKFGDDILELRHRTWKTLKRLNEIYTRLGAEEFMQALQEPAEPLEVNTLLDNVRFTASKYGASDAAGKIERMLTIAKEHQEEITRVAPTWPLMSATVNKPGQAMDETW